MTADRPPFFSVVMPLYNKAEHVEATLASIAAQRFRDFEVVVVDDGSSDDGPSRVSGMGLTYLRLVAQRNGGPGLARNRGIAEARGTWIAFLDADDLWLPSHLDECARVIASVKDCDVVATRYVRAVRESDHKDVAARAGVIRQGSFLADAEQVWTSCTAVRASVARDSGGFGATWPGEDVEFWFRLSLRYRLAVSDLVTAIYVQDTGGAMDAGAGSRPEADDILAQPIFSSIARALAGPLPIAERGEIERYRNALLLAYTRPCLFRGETQAARAYLSHLSRFGGRAPLAYRLLARMPGRGLASAMRWYSAAKRQVGRRSRP